MYAKHQQIVTALRRMGLRPLDPSLPDDHFIMVAVFYAGGSAPWTPIPNARKKLTSSEPRVAHKPKTNLSCPPPSGHLLFIAEALLACVKHVRDDAVHENPTAADELQESTFKRCKAFFDPRLIAIRRNNGSFSRKFIQIQPRTLP